MEPIKVAGRTTIFSIFFASIFTLLLLVLVNHTCLRRWPRRQLARTELLTIYVITNFGVAFIGVDMLQVLVPMMAYPVHRAALDPRWDTLVFQHLPKWLIVQDLDAGRAMYVGGANFWSWDILRHWLLPIGAWTGFIMLLLTVMLCLNSLLRRQWTEREKLAFPMVAVPLAITDDSRAIFRSQLMWSAFALAFAINVWNSFHVLHPSMPEIPVAARRINRGITEMPWRAIGNTFASGYPWMVGLGYLLPVDLLFSGPFFFWVWKLERVAATAYGWVAESPDAPYIVQQNLGGYLGLCLLALWYSRRHLWSALRAAFIPGSDPAEHEEAMSYRAALLGLLLGSAGLMVFSVAAGIAPVLAAIYLCVYLGVSVAITRIRSEFGAPVHDLHMADAGKMMVLSQGASYFRPSDLGGFTMFFWFNRAYRSHPMAFQLEGWKIADHAHQRRSTMAWVMMLAGFVGVLAAFAALLTPYYRLGLDSAEVLGNPRTFSRQGYQRMMGWMTNSTPPDPLSNLFLAFGVAQVFLLSWIRLHWLGFPLHPVSFAVSGSWNMNLLWLPLTAAWILKASILRYGGLRLYRQLMPLFMGLILGDFCGITITNLVAIALDVPAYRLFY